MDEDIYMPWPCRSRSASLPHNYYINHHHHHHHHHHPPPVGQTRQFPTASANPWTNTNATPRTNENSNPWASANNNPWTDANRNPWINENANPWTRPPAAHPTTYNQRAPATLGQSTRSQVPPQPPQVPAWATPGSNVWVPTPLSCAAPLVYTPRAPRPAVQVNRYPILEVPPMFNPPLAGQQTPVFPTSPWTPSPFSPPGLQAPHKKKSSKTRHREEMNPSANNPLHRNLTEIDWDIRKPVSHAVCFTGTGNLAKLRKHGAVTLPWYSHLPIVMYFDVGSSEADWVTMSVLTNLMTYHNAKGHSWASAIAVPTENQPLTVKNVLDVIRNYWYEPLTPGEIRYIYSMGLHEAVAHSNAERAAIVGEHWSDRDDARLRRIDLLGHNTRFQGFRVVRVDNSIQLRYTLKRDAVGDF